ncbi:Uma2 family endonuclease [Thiolinea disciformis]|uniref:Uma2 family endonuclease n=1 Tax=Thiolinea disciformis TaxID=125614 RepID=UPI00037B53AC|nr:Uma2 family endonuclease [Thiolinea disciformis]
MQAIKNQVSREDYLKLEDISTEKHEFYQGQVFAMAGGTFQHARIGLNVTTELAVRLRAKPCQPMNSDMRIVTPSGLNTYPDASVYCGKPELTDNNKTLLNPVLIIEVLSPSTRSYDRGDKFHHYRSIPSLRDYLLIDSETILVEHYQRKGTYEWNLHEYRQLTDVLSLVSIEQQLTVSVFYEGVELLISR